MLPQVGFAELLVLAILALVVVGPRDLPRLMRQVGGIMAKARGMAREFQRSFDEMGRETEIAELRKEIQDLRRIEPLEDVKRELTDVERDTRDAVRGE